MKRSTNEKLVGWLFIASLTIVALGLLFPCFSSWFNLPIFDRLAVFCWGFCVVPFMSLQFFIPSGIYVYFFSDLHFVLRIIIFWVLAPMANLFFFFWMGTLFNFLPYYDSFKDVLPTLVAYSSALAWALLGLAAAVRIIKQKRIREGRS